MNPSDKIIMNPQNYNGSSLIVNNPCKFFSMENPREDVVCFSEFSAMK